ncbi:MAG: DUF5455 family protein [Gammaproteobacteria bacterium]|nr:DUF5455 family protein [Gammaproteobacteria bacterium]
MAAFLTFIVTGLTSFFRIFVAFAAQRLGLAVIYIGVYVAAVTALATGFTELFSSLATSAPSNGFLAAGLSLVPPNASVCISAISSAYALSALFTFHQRALKIKVTTK